MLYKLGIFSLETSYTVTDHDAVMRSVLLLLSELSSLFFRSKMYTVFTVKQSSSDSPFDKLHDNPIKFFLRVQDRIDLLCMQHY